MKARYSSISSFPVFAGVMMQSPRYVTLAVRLSSGRILLKSYPYYSWLKNWNWTGLPCVRGVVSYLEGLYVSVQALAYSLPVFLEDPKNKDRKRQFLTFLAAIIGGLLMFVSLPDFLTGTLVDDPGAILSIGAIGGIKVCFVLFYMTLLARMKLVKEFLSYKGSGNAAIKAFNQNDDLVIENVARQSPRYSRDRETQLLIVFILTIFIFPFVAQRIGAESWFENPVLNQFNLLVLSLILSLPLMGLVYEIQLFLSRQANHPVWKILLLPFFMLQATLLRKNMDSNRFEIPVVALRQVLRLEKGIPSPLSQRESMDMQGASEDGGEEFEIQSSNDLGRVRIDVNDFLEA